MGYRVSKIALIAPVSDVWPERGTSSVKQVKTIMRSTQGLIQKEKVHIDCEKGAQISILANKMTTQ